MASRRALHLLTPYRGISSTPHLASLGWFDKIKSTFTGKKPEASEADSFTLIKFADTMEMARKVGTFKNFVAGRASEATVVNAFEKHSAVLRYLGAIDPTGEKLQNSDKINATKHCNCTIADVEHILAKYTWAKEAQKKMAKLKEEGKPLPKTFNEIQNLVGSTPMDVGRSNLAKSGQISRNALCPCGSKHSHIIQGRCLIPRPGNAVPIRGSGSKRVSVPFKVGSRPGLRGVVAPLLADLIGIRRLLITD